jgi:diaminopimelate decarboxylase
MPFITAMDIFFAKNSMSPSRRRDLVLRAIYIARAQYISTGKSENKFGIALERAAKVYEGASKMPAITIRGVQMHIGSQITEAAPFVAAIDEIAPLVSELKNKYAIEFFSVGGGLGIVYESSIASGSGDWWTSQRSHPLTIQQYVDAILPPLTRLGPRILRNRCVRFLSYCRPRGPRFSKKYWQTLQLNEK